MSDITSSKNTSFTNGPYVWFVGIVENVEDPEMNNRVQVRILGYHPDAEGAISINDLPWALIEKGAFNTNTKKFGYGPHMLMKGSTVKGHFLDGNDAQMPMITGTWDGEDDTHDLIKGKNTLNKELMSSNGIKEPKSKYDAKYPHNKVLSTPSGHIIEIDDTPNAERIHIYHKSGTFIEIHPNGETVYKHKSNSYFLTQGDCSQITQGNYQHNITGNAKFIIGGDCTFEVNGSFNVQSGKTVNIKSGSSANIQAGGSITIKASGTLTGKAAIINMN